MFSWFKSEEKKEAPGFWADYLALFQERLPKNTPLAELSFVIFDTETSGLDAQKDQILSIGAVKVRNWQIRARDRFECYLHQSYSPTEENVAIHGILPTNAMDSLEEKDAIRAFLSFIGSGVLVGHHVGFDIAFINAALKSLVGGKLKNKRIDTVGMARRLEPASYHIIRREDYSLDTLCRQYQIPIHDRHTAAGDAFMTALLFLKLLARLRSRGVRNLGSLLQ